MRRTQSIFLKCHFERMRASLVLALLALGLVGLSQAAQMPTVPVSNNYEAASNADDLITKVGLIVSPRPPPPLPCPALPPQPPSRTQPAHILRPPPANHSQISSPPAFNLAARPECCPFSRHEQCYPRLLTSHHTPKPPSPPSTGPRAWHPQRRAGQGHPRSGQGCRRC